MHEMIKRLEPKNLIIYGARVDFDYGNITVKYYENETIARLKEIPKKKKKKPEEIEEKMENPGIKEEVKKAV